MRALEPGEREGRLEAVVRAQGHEAIGLLAAAAAQHRLDRRAKVVVAHERGDAPKEGERLGVSLEEGLLGLVVKGLGVGDARVAEAQVEEVHAGERPGEHDVGLAPVDLGLHPCVVDLRDEGPPRLAELASAGAHVAADGPLADVGLVLLDKALKDAPGGVALLARCLAVGDEPLVDQLVEGPERRCGAALGTPSLRRQRRVERLADGAPMHAVALGERPDRQPLVIVVASDLFELLHPRSHPLCDLRLELQWSSDGRVAVGRGGASSSGHGGAR